MQSLLFGHMMQGSALGYSFRLLCGVFDGVVGDGASGGFPDGTVLWIEWVGFYADNFWF
jgi:hypothetical protein